MVRKSMRGIAHKLLVDPRRDQVPSTGVLGQTVKAVFGGGKKVEENLYGDLISFIKENWESYKPARIVRALEWSVKHLRSIIPVASWRTCIGNTVDWPKVKSALPKGGGYYDTIAMATAEAIAYGIRSRRSISRIVHSVINRNKLVWGEDTILDGFVSKGAQDLHCKRINAKNAIHTGVFMNVSQHWRHRQEGDFLIYATKYLAMRETALLTTKRILSTIYDVVVGTEVDETMETPQIWNPAKQPCVGEQDKGFGKVNAVAGIEPNSADLLSREVPLPRAKPVQEGDLSEDSGTDSTSETESDLEEAPSSPVEGMRGAEEGDPNVSDLVSDNEDSSEVGTDLENRPASTQLQPPVSPVKEAKELTERRALKVASFNCTGRRHMGEAIQVFKDHDVESTSWQSWN